MRRYFIDHLRAGTVLSVILYHIVYMFNSIGIIRNVDIAGVPQMDVLIYILYPWFMVCLFLLAGMCARYSLQTRTPKEFIRERVHKLLIPSIAGIFLLGWISGFVTNQYTDMFQGEGARIPLFVKYLIYCLCGIGPLWFAHELFLASLVLLLIRKLDKQDRLGALGAKTNLPVLFLLVFAVWGSSYLLNTPLIEVYRNGIYLFMFLLGYYVFPHENVLALLKRYRFLFLGIALVLCVLYTLRFWGENNTTMANLQHPLTNAYAWFATLALLGCGYAWGSRETRFTAHMRTRSFGFYVLHYPVMVLLTYALDRTLHPSGISFYLLLLIAEALCLPLVYELLSRIPLLNTLLLGAKRIPLKQHSSRHKP